MKLYVTFGQAHKHKIDKLIFDKDCVAVIKCDSYKEGRDRAFELFGPKFCFTYLEKEFKLEHMTFFPRGFIKTPIPE